MMEYFWYILASVLAGVETGVVLTLLGAALILLHYWEYIKAVPLLYGVLGCTLEFWEYIIPAAAILLCLYHFFKIPSHVFRKLLHLAAFTCLVEMMWAAEEWYQASLTALLFAAAVYPILCALEGQPWFGGLFVQKGPGEVKKSLLLLFVMDAALVAVCWGGFGLPWAAAASIFGAYTELISKNGYDTVTVPVVNTAVLLGCCLLSAG